MANIPRRLNELPSVTVDPNFFVPDGVTGLIVSEPEENNEDPGLDDSYFEDEPANVEFEPETDPVAESIPELGVPDNFTIVEQQLRIGPGGRILVDIIVDVPDVIGASNYDVRISKVG